MELKNTDTNYGVVAKSLHWILAIMIIGLLSVGLYMEDLAPSDQKWQLYSLHKAIGIIALALVALRLIWRFMNPQPSLPTDIPAYQKLASRLTHYGLYFLMFAMPLAGWVMSSAGGHPISVFGLPIPPIVGEDKALGKLANTLHGLGGWAFIALISLHFAAALYHQFIRKDGILKRMV